LDLRDVWRKGGGATRLTWRRVAVLIDRLPPESALKTAIRDEVGAAELAAQAKRNEREGSGSFGPYSNTDMHLSMIIDELRWLRYSIYHAQGGKPKRPSQYPRPGVAPAAGKRQVTDAGRAHLAQLRAERAAQRSGRQPVPVPPHIAAAGHKKLGPAEKAWLTEQLANLRNTRPTPPEP
jgi:hypothetical protein